MDAVHHVVIYKCQGYNRWSRADSRSHFWDWAVTIGDNIRGRFPTFNAAKAFAEASLNIDYEGYYSEIAD